MNTANEIKRILQPWSSPAGIQGVRGLIDREQVQLLRRYAAETSQLLGQFNRLCTNQRSHMNLRLQLQPTPERGLWDLTTSASDWGKLENTFRQNAGLILPMSRQLLSEGDDLFDRVNRMDIIAQLNCSIGDLTEEKLRELKSRPLSPADLQTRQSLAQIIQNMTERSMLMAIYTSPIKKATLSFSTQLRQTVLPKLVRLNDATFSQMCRTQQPPCPVSSGNTSVKIPIWATSGAVDGAATALDDIVSLLITYLTIAVGDLYEMDDNLKILYFLLELRGVLMAWGEIAPLLQGTLEALEPTA